MSVAMRRPMTIAEFLAWEEGQALRWEFDGFAPVAVFEVLSSTLRNSGREAESLDESVQ